MVVKNRFHCSGCWIMVNGWWSKVKMVIHSHQLVIKYKLCCYKTDTRIRNVVEWFFKCFPFNHIYHLSRTFKMSHAITSHDGEAIRITGHSLNRGSRILTLKKCTMGITIFFHLHHLLLLSWQAVEKKTRKKKIPPPPPPPHTHTHTHTQKKKKTPGKHCFILGFSR